ncbi:MAG: MMPL family transporter [Polyangiaceae bacterium]
MSSEVDAPSPRLRAFVDWTLRHGRAIWLIAILLALPAAWRTATLYLHLKSDLEELLPRDAPSVHAIDELRARTPGLQYLGVVVDVGDPANLPAGERFVDDLASRVRAYPKDLARSVRTGTEEERAFLEAHAPLYVDLADLKSIRARIEVRRDFDVARATGALLEEDEETRPPPLDFSDIEKKYDAKLVKGASRDGDRYSSKKLHLTMLLVEVGGFETGSHHGKTLLAKVRADASALGGPAAYAPGMRLGFTGDVAISTEETDALVADLFLSSALVIVAVTLVLVLYFRWWRSVLVLIPPLLLAAVYSFAIASFLGVRELNSNTAFLGSIIIGNGINFGIVLLARYVEERRRGSDVHGSLVTGVWSARRGTLAAAVGAGVAYVSLVITQFRGFRQFGIIGGIGMLLSWLVAFLCMPSLVAWLDRGAGTIKPREMMDRVRVMGWLGRFLQRYRLPVAVLGGILTLGAIVTVRGFDMSHVEYDFSKLRRADTWASGEGYWGRKMDALLGEYLTPTVLLADSPEEARTIAARLRKETTRPPLAGMVSSIRTLDDVLPTDQDPKIEEAAKIREDMTPKLRALIAPEKRAELDRLLGTRDQTRITLADLPRTFTTALVERDGSAGRAVLVFPRPSKALWQGPPLVAFVGALRSAAVLPGAPAARVAGSLPLSADIISSIQHDGPLASAAAFIGVIAAVLVMFRRQSMTAYVIASLTVGVLWLGALTIVLGVKINFANFIAFPITFGIGVDYAVNVMSRYVQDGRRDVIGTVRATGSAVALCSLTTIIGYSSLLVAENRALFLFGLIAVLGEIACLTAAVTLLPSVLLLVDGRRAEPAPAEE